MPNAENPLHDRAFAGSFKCDQLAVGEKKNTPTTIAAIANTLPNVSSDCSRPPKTTRKQLIPAKSRITATATICCDPKLQSTFCPRKSNEALAQTAFNGINP